MIQLFFLAAGPQILSQNDGTTGSDYRKDQIQKENILGNKPNCRNGVIAVRTEHHCVYGRNKNAHKLFHCDREG